MVKNDVFWKATLRGTNRAKSFTNFGGMSVGATGEMQLAAEAASWTTSEVSLGSSSPCVRPLPKGFPRIFRKIAYFCLFLPFFPLLVQKADLFFGLLVIFDILTPKMRVYFAH